MTVVLITGGSGFIGSCLKRQLRADYNPNPIFRNQQYEILTPPRILVDWTNSEEVKSYFAQNQDIDVVIHCASIGGRRLNTDGVNVLVDNVRMFENIVAYKPSYTVIINMSSGAAYDRERHLIEVSESKILTYLPKDMYGLAKNLIAKRCYGLERCYNLILFNCFGPTEAEGRFVTGAINAIKSNEPFTITPRLMDFFYINDLVTIVKFYIEEIFNGSRLLPNSLNCVYNGACATFGILHMLQAMMKIEARINVMPHDKPYCGSSKLLQGLNIPHLNLDTGLKDGLRDCIK